jgi:hypothetical protein
VTTFLLIAYQHRKQMRQIELFRLDQKVGLVRPPHPLRVFFQRYWWDLLAFGWGFYLFARGLIESSLRAKTDPAERIAEGLVVITWVGFFFVWNMLGDRSLRLAEHLVAMQGRMVAIQEKETALILQIIQILGHSEELSKTTRDNLAALLPNKPVASQTQRARKCARTLEPICVQAILLSKDPPFMPPRRHPQQLDPFGSSRWNDSPRPEKLDQCPVRRKCRHP